jgi:REP element-mobilizing transposase RayT
MPGMGLLAYFISFHTYGSWIHGHAQGSIDDDHNRPGTPFLASNPVRLDRELQALKHPPVELDAQRRFVVHATIHEVASHRHWILHAINVRLTHVHVVVSAQVSPERIMSDFKAYSTRRLREATLLDAETHPWSHHGSTRYLNTEKSFARAVQYVIHEQGKSLDMCCPPEWKPPPPHNERRA